MSHVSLRLLFVTLLCVQAGCDRRPPSVTVRGKILLGDKPLAGARVYFAPQNGNGSFASATTDDSGEYVLSESDTTAGILPGSYRVSISTFVEAVSDNDPPLPRVPERVPAIYNVKSTLTREVFGEPAEQVLNFELETGGEIIQLDSP